MVSHFIKLGLKDNVNLASSIIYQFPSIDTKKFKCYEFPKIEEAIYQEQSLSQYEIPQYIQEIPEGFSIFCTLWEASKVKQYMQLSQEEQEKLGIGEREEKNSDDILLQEPIPNTNYCHVCRRKFDDYLLHLETMIHKNNISKNQMMINTAKDTFKRINQFWNNKNNNNSNNLDYNLKKYNSNETIEKCDNNKLCFSSSVSTAISTFKYEESNTKDINAFHDIYNSDYERNNDKENQCENNKNIKNTKDKSSKSNNIFMTPYRKGQLIEKSNINSSSSHNSFNMFINKKRKNNNSINEEKEEKENDYFPKLNSKETKKLIRGIDIFFK